jgi:hypothetical protein
VVSISFGFFALPWRCGHGAPSSWIPSRAKCRPAACRCAAPAYAIPSRAAPSTRKDMAAPQRSQSHTRRPNYWNALFTSGRVNHKTIAAATIIPKRPSETRPAAICPISPTPLAANIVTAIRHPHKRLWKQPQAVSPMIPDSRMRPMPVHG